MKNNITKKQNKKHRSEKNSMMVTTTEHIPNREVQEVLGVVFGSCVQTKHLGKDLRAAGRTLIGGENISYTELVEEARRVAMKRLISDAEKLNADAIVGMRYATAQTMGSAAEIIAFGTAVKTF